MRVFIVITVAATLSACASLPPDATEIHAMQRALKSSSTEAAQAAVKAYFAQSLIHAMSAG
jgi:hypothetical protein